MLRRPRRLGLLREAHQLLKIQRAAKRFDLRENRPTCVVMPRSGHEQVPQAEVP